MKNVITHLNNDDEIEMYHKLTKQFVAIQDLLYDSRQVEIPDKYASDYAADVNYEEGYLSYESYVYHELMSDCCADTHIVSSVNVETGKTQSHMYTNKYCGVGSCPYCLKSQELEEVSKLTITCNNSLSQYRDDSYSVIQITVKLSAIEELNLVDMYKKVKKAVKFLLLKRRGGQIAIPQLGYISIVKVNRGACNNTLMTFDLILHNPNSSQNNYHINNYQFIGELWEEVSKDLNTPIVISYQIEKEQLIPLIEDKLAASHNPLNIMKPKDTASNVSTSILSKSTRIGDGKWVNNYLANINDVPKVSAHGTFRSLYIEAGNRFERKKVKDRNHFTDITSSQSYL